MAEANEDERRVDPYGSFPFRVRWHGRRVAGFHKLSIPKRTSALRGHEDVGDAGARRSSRRVMVDAFHLENGISDDPEFARWIQSGIRNPSGLETKRAVHRDEIVIEVCNEAGQLVLAYRLLHARVSDHEALSDLDGNAVAVGIQLLALETEGWMLDRPVVEPVEPPFEP